MALLKRKPKEERSETPAIDWNFERYMSARRSANRAWAVAGIAGVLSIVSVVAIAGLTPLKTVEPVVIRVEEATGIVDVVGTLRDASESYGEAITRYFLTKYIRSREGYLRATAERDYELVSVMSAQAEREAWFSYFNPRNEESPLRRYGESGEVRIDIRNISFITDTTALIRYRRTVLTPGNEARDERTATVTFRYSDAAMSEELRLENPVGFQVTSYRSDPVVAEEGS